MSRQIDAFPLSWPQGWPRSSSRPKKAQFKSSLARARDNLLKEVTRLGGRNPVLSTNVPLRNDGLPYAKYAALNDLGAAIYFQLKEKPMVFACDRWATVDDNIHALYLSIKAIRGIERWGASDMLERAFTGFQALPSPDEVSATDTSWWSVLGVTPDATDEEIREAWTKLAKTHHPDVNPASSQAKMAAINKAKEEAYGARRSRRP